MMLSRRAQLNVWMTAAIFVVVGLLILFIGFKVAKTSERIGDDEKCRLSLVANDVVRPVAKRVYPIECPRDHIEISFGDVEKYGRIDDDLVKTIIAEEMKRCWSKTGGGTLQPFNEHWLEQLTGEYPFLEVFCLVCTEIDFSEDFREQARNQDYRLEGLLHWLVTRKPFGMKSTLYEQITGKSPSADIIKALKGAEFQQGSSFDLDETHVITWKVELPLQSAIEQDELKYFGKDALEVFSEGIFAIPESQPYGPGAGLGTPFDLVEYWEGVGEDIDTVEERFEEQPLERVMFTPKDTLSAFTEDKLDFIFFEERRQFCSIMVN